jgi:hypothetical protein
MSERRRRLRENVNVSVVILGFITVFFAIRTSVQFGAVPLNSDHIHTATLCTQRTVCLDVKNILTCMCCVRTASVVSWSDFLATDPEARVRFPALPEKSSGSGTEFTQPREHN